MCSKCIFIKCVHYLDMKQYFAIHKSGKEFFKSSVVYLFIVHIPKEW